MKVDAEPTVVSAAGWRALAKTSSSSWEGEGREDSLASARRETAPVMAACAEICHVPAKGCGEHWHQELLCPLVFEYRGWSGAGLHFPTPPGCQGGGGRKQQLQKMHIPFHIYLHEMTKWLQTGWGDCVGGDVKAPGRAHVNKQHMAGQCRVPGSETCCEISLLSL